jgi:RNA polymerase sigma-70 factor (sigma-E family)
VVLMPDGFDEFVVSRGHVLLRFAYLLTGDRHLAQDLVQEVLVRAHRRWERIERLDMPDAYLRKAILRQYLSWRRRRASSEIVVAAIPDRGDGHDPAGEAAERDEMWSLLATLPRAQRAVLVLRYYEDLPDDEIARLTGCSPTTVRVHAFRALARLRESLTRTSTRSEANHA